MHMYMDVLNIPSDKLLPRVPYRTDGDNGRKWRLADVITCRSGMWTVFAVLRTKFGNIHGLEPGQIVGFNYVY